MSIIDNIKDSARKVTNSVVDTAEGIMNKPKSPKELAVRLIEHLSNAEYNKVAEILSDESKKYASHLGLDDFPLIETKLNDFKSHLENLADDLEGEDYSTVASKIHEVESNIPEEIGGHTEILSSLKSLLQEIAKILEEHSQEDENNEQPDFDRLKEIFESYFTKIVAKTTL